MTQIGSEGPAVPPPVSAAPSPGAFLDRDRPVVALGVALLATAVVLASFHGRGDDGDLVAAMLAVGLLATAGLLAVAVAARLRERRTGRPDDDATDRVAWPGAFGAASAGLMVALVLDDGAATPYVAGLLVLALSLLGLARTGRAPFAVSGVLAAAVVCGAAFDDLWPTPDDGGQRTVGTALGITVFTLLVTAVGWLFPARVVAAVTAGALAVGGFVTLTATLATQAALQASVTESFEDAAWGMSWPEELGSDGWVLLGLAALLVLAWLACAALTGHQGFRLLVVAMAVSVTPLVLVAVQSEHPTWWAAALALGGAALLVPGVRRPRPATRVAPL